MQLVQQGKRKQEYVSHRGPQKEVGDQRDHSPPAGVRGAPGFSAVTHTQHSHNWGGAVEEGSFNLPLGIHQLAGKTSANTGEGTSLKVLNSCFSSLKSPNRVREETVAF